MLNHTYPQKESVLRINAKETLCYFLGGGIEGWKEGAGVCLILTQTAWRNHCLLGRGNEGEPDGSGREKEKKNQHKKACFAVLVNHWISYVWIS